MSTTEPATSLSWKFAIFLCLLSSLLGAISLPPIGWRPLALIGWLPLLWIALQGSRRQAFYLGLVQGIVLYSLSLYWLMRLFGPAILALVSIMGLFVALFCLLINIFRSQIQNPWLFALYSALVWVGLEYYRSEWFILRFPWATPGLAYGITWLTPLIGVYGTSLLIFLGGTLLLQRKTAISGAVILVVLLVSGFIRPGKLTPERPLRVLAVQDEEVSLEDYIAASRSRADWKPELVIWPEYAVSTDLRKFPKDLQQVITLARDLNCTIVLGTKTELDATDDRFWNTSLIIDSSGVRGEHHKNRPVHFFKDGVEGKTQLPVETLLGKLGTPICFDNDYELIDRRMTAQGAELLASPSFDGKLWTATQHLQHAELFRMRAAENGRWLVCAATSGKTQIVDPHGNMQAGLPLMTPGVLTGVVGRTTGLTFYTRCGWLLTPIASIIALIWSVTGLILARMKRLNAEKSPLTSES